MTEIGLVDSSVSSGFLEEIPSSPLLQDLPEGFLPYEQFLTQFSLGTASTELSHLNTKRLSQTMQGNLLQGLELLLNADEAVIEGLERFLPATEPLAKELGERLNKGGRLFLVGSGSSGRVAIDLAAQYGVAFPEAKDQIRGIIAGGDAAFIQAKEGFEDSEREGEKVLASFDLKPEDTVLLISASGSSSFNVGCGHYAANQGSQVLYFYNSREIPSRTQKLFERINNPVVPLELDIGPQAIAGSTRLQGANVAEVCLGALLEKTLFPESNSDLVKQLQESLSLVRNHLPEIAQFVLKEKALFSDASSNFRRVVDQTSQGYVTFAGMEDTVRMILLDATEIAPTFSTSPIRRKGEEHLKKEEFKAYLVGQQENSRAWNALLGREPDSETDAFFLLPESDRMGKGNLWIGAVNLLEDSKIPPSLDQVLKEASLTGSDTGLIALCNACLSQDEKNAMSQGKTLSLIVDSIPSSKIVQTHTLKQILNLISNGSMILMNKIHGNKMVDVKASNGKLIDRCLRLIKEIWSETGRSLPCADREIYQLIAQAHSFKQTQTAQGRYTPSVIKLVLAYLYLEKDPSFQKAADFLHLQEESLDFLRESYTFCIDGGGSKTELQILDRQGHPIPFQKEGRIVTHAQAGPSNINVIKKEGVRSTLNDLFKDIQIQGKNVQEILPRSRVVAGMAGAGVSANHEAIASLYQEQGVDFTKLTLLNDGEMAVRLHRGNGIVLISGTGSVCFAEKDGVRYRAGGLGKILGDEGSAYQMGLQAIQAGLREEYGYGPATLLTASLKEHFKIAELKSLIPRINSGEMPQAEIAEVSSLVFEKASQGDLASQVILSRIADDLREMVATALKISKLFDCELHLWGGIFKNEKASALIAKIQQDPLVQWRNLKIVNQSNENVAAAYARKFAEVVKDD